MHASVSAHSALALQHVPAETWEQVPLAHRSWVQGSPSSHSRGPAQALLIASVLPVLGDPPSLPPPSAALHLAVVAVQGSPGRQEQAKPCKLIHLPPTQGEPLHSNDVVHADDLQWPMLQN